MIKIYKSGTWHEIHDNTKQDTLTSGTNIKTINGNSVLGSGDITIASEPEAYIKNIAEAGNIYTATKKDDSTVSWTIPDISGKADTSTVEALDTRVSANETAIAEKAAQSDLTALTGRVGANETNITALQTDKADTTALDSYILKTAVDGKTIKFEDDQLKAILPAAMVFKGSKDFVTQVKALTDMQIGDTWFVWKDDRETTPEDPNAPIVNALVTYAATGWVYVGDTYIDLSIYAKQADLTTLDGKVQTLAGTVTTLDTTVGQHTTQISSKAAQASLDETNTKVAANETAITNHVGDTDVHIQSGERDTWNAKQDALDATQMAAVDSGITSTKVGTYDGYASQISAKQKQIVYSETEPASVEDGDVWVF